MDRCIVYQCNSCTLEYINDQEYKIDNNYLKNYNKVRNEKSTSSKLRQIQYTLDAKHFSQNVSQGNVLDVGCSTGDFLNILSQKPDLRLFGIDTDKDAISTAKIKCNSEINFLNTDLINYQSNLKFDCIIFRGSFQFLGSDLKETLNKISEISSKNTKIIIYSLPNSDSILYYFLKDKWNLFDEFSHTLIFNKTSLSSDNQKSFFNDKFIKPGPSTLASSIYLIFFNSLISKSAKLLGEIFKNLDKTNAAFVDTSPNLSFGGSLT